MLKTVKILLADDHSVVRTGLKTLLERQKHFKVIAEAETGQEAIEKAQASHPHIAVLDIRMRVFLALKPVARLSTQSKVARLLC